MCCPMTKNIPSGAPYVTLQIKNQMKKSQNMLVYLRKMVLLLHMCSAEAGKRCKQSCIPAREECNKYDLTGVPGY